MEDKTVNETKPKINVTPLIDVLLVLLIIFMVISPIKPTDFKTKIPQEPKATIGDPHPLALIVSLDSESEIKINDVTENFGNSENTSPLIEELTRILKEREQNSVYDETGEKIQKTVFIKAPKSLAYGKVVKIVDAVKIAGAEPISLQIDYLD
ncbi:MAG: biopolymer transporter ExbD [Pyrinomonadaceae bacterium]